MTLVGRMAEKDTNPLVGRMAASTNPKLVQLQAEQAQAKAESDKANSFGGLLKNTLTGLPQRANKVVSAVNEAVVKPAVKTVVVRPAINLANTVGTGIAKVASKATGNPAYYDRALELIQQPTDLSLPLVGRMSIKPETSYKQVAGEGLEAASYLYTPGRAAEAISPLLKASEGVAPTLKQALVKKGVNLAENALGGYAADVGFGLQDKNKSIKQALKPGLGTAISTAIPLAVEGAQAVKSGAELYKSMTPLERQAGYIKNPLPNQYAGEKDLTSSVLDELEGKTNVSKQYISDLTNRPEMKQAERDLVRQHLASYADGSQIPVKDFANKVKSELLPLTSAPPTDSFGRSAGGGRNVNDTAGLGYRYENITLPSELRGPVADYKERIYSSPISTSAGGHHFDASNKNYFAHSRIEDLPPAGTGKFGEQIMKQGAKFPNAGGDTRRVIEIQSDLFQKGRLEGENMPPRFSHDETGTKEKELYDTRAAEIAKLEPYRNTWHERVIREEVKQAAIDGKTKLQFPTGETAMKIEGLGEMNDANWWSVAGEHGIDLTPEKLKVGLQIVNAHDNWIITDVLGDGKFTAVPKDKYEQAIKQGLKPETSGFTETFDIFGKVDTNNPIYKFYEKEVGRYLKNKYNAALITDPQGVKWWEVNVNKDHALRPMGAFGDMGKNLPRKQGLLGEAKARLDDGGGQGGYIKNPLAPDEKPNNLPEHKAEEGLLGRKLSQEVALGDKETTPLKQSGEKPVLGGVGQGDPSLAPTLLPENDPVKKIVIALKESKPLLKKQDALYRAERAKRVARLVSAGERVKGEQGYFSQLGQLKGELPKVEFESLRNKVNQTDVDSLFNQVEEHKLLSPFEKITAKGALAKLLGEEGGRIPTRNELQLLGEVFPPEFMKAVLAKRPLLQKVLEGANNLINVPRAIMATADLSAPLRQGIFLIGRPKQWMPAFGQMFKYALSEKAYQGLTESIQSRGTYKLMRENGLALTDMSKFNLDSREEQFMSNLVEKIPIFGRISRGSNRAYSGFLNKLRADTFDDLLRSAKTLGIDKERPQVIADIARFVNSATGRGEVTKLFGLNKAAPTLNAVFFSPRLMASRLNLLSPAYYYKLDPFVRKEALKSLLTFAGTATTVLTLAKLNGAEVGEDPRSADFGKIKYGNTRYDILGGFQQYIKLASQLISGKIVSSTTGKEITLGEGYKPLTRKDVAQRFFEAKTSPVASFAIALMTGQNGVGQPVDVPTEVINRSTPLLIQDIYDLAKERGFTQSLLMGVPGIFGAGMQTYGGQELVKGKNKIGQDTVQVRPKQGIAESLSTKIFGEKPLGSSSSYDVEAYYDQLLKLPKAEAAKKFEEIKKVNPQLSDKILQVHKDRELGITVHDKALREKGVASGDRAMALAEEFAKLKTKEEKAKLWNEYSKKKIITPEVAKQLTSLLKPK